VIRDKNLKRSRKFGGIASFDDMGTGRTSAKNHEIA
jgi:hypothetical protein